MNKLATPKGTKRVCEICANQACFACYYCQVAFYCTIRHRRQDGVHGLICRRLRIIRNPSIFMQDTIGRRRIIGMKSFMKEKLVDDFIRQAYSFLNQRNYRGAILTLNHSLKLVVDVYGEKHCSLQLIAIYTALSDAHVGLKHFLKANMSLKMAIIALIRAEDDGLKKLNFAKAQVNKSQGLLLSAAQNWTDAIFFFSEYIYQMTKSLSPCHVRVCAGYFYLAKGFLALGQAEKGMSVLSFCVQLWYDFLHDIVMPWMKALGRRSSVALTKVEDDSEKHMSSMTKMEVTRGISEVWEHMDERKHTKLACKITLCEGMLMFLNKDYHGAIVHAEHRSLALAREVHDPELVRMCKHLMRQGSRMERKSEAPH